MKHVLRGLAAALLLTAATASPAAAAKPGSSGPAPSFALVNSEAYTAQPVDWLTWCGDCVNTDYTTGNPWVVNPTGCTWDTDDEFTWSNDWSSSTVPPGASSSFSHCDYESWTSGRNGVIHVADVQFTSTSPDLVISVTFSSSAGTPTVVVRPAWDASARRYNYHACIEVPQQTDQPTVTVAGSNGGTAVPVSITGSIRNPTAHQIGKTGGVFEFGWLHFYGAGCSWPLQP